jgi:hypothetical protein
VNFSIIEIIYENDITAAVSTKRASYAIAWSDMYLLRQRLKIPLKMPKTSVHQPNDDELA